ncbi:MAG TPA: Mpo1-like protein, partial [Woeseiaceae bacterium]|nr:Mpo1-like protein [Woeseiaceae bacterium]
MSTNSKLMEMLTGYAAAHQHPVNIAVHLVGIPVIMLGVFIALAQVTVEIEGFSFDLAQLAAVGLFLFYLTLDWIFALVFLLAAYLIAMLAGWIAAQPDLPSMTIAAAAFFGGYLAQFIGHAVEKSPPVILKHPV